MQDAVEVHSDGSSGEDPMPAQDRDDDPGDADVCSIIGGVVSKFGTSSLGRKPGMFADENRIYRHKVRMTYHYGSVVASDRVACGRQISGQFELVQDVPASIWPKCGTCFGTL